jgi:hypothetical protein
LPSIESSDALAAPTGMDIKRVSTTMRHLSILEHCAHIPDIRENSQWLLSASCLRTPSAIAKRSAGHCWPWRNNSGRPLLPEDISPLCTARMIMPNASTLRDAPPILTAVLWRFSVPTPLWLGPLPESLEVHCSATSPRARDSIIGRSTFERVEGNSSLPDTLRRPTRRWLTSQPGIRWLRYDPDAPRSASPTAISPPATTSA